ncbi:MAG: 2-dehydropantoate 2-reductase [Myxococcota bacterium]
MAENENTARVLVVGCGGIGGIVAANMVEMGVDVTCVTGNPAIAEAINTRGFKVHEEGAARTVQGAHAHAKLPDGAGPFDFILLATQPTEVESAATAAAPSLKPDGRMVCFQNGLCEWRVARIVGADRTVGGIVAWGASMVEPGVYDRTAAGGFVLGMLDGRVDPRLEELGRYLEAVGPVQVSHNLQGARWSKLAINCAISALGTLGGDTLGSLMTHRFIRRLCLELMTEVVAVARAEGVRLEKVSGTLDLEWIALTESERTIPGSPNLFAKHGLLLAVGARYRRMRSSMLRAIERGRPPAVDFLNGEVVERAKAHRIPVPVNAAAVEHIHQLARKELQPSLDLAKRFFESTAHVRG